jgi:O-antigen/teichoic acid export membrane protein
MTLNKKLLKGSVILMVLFGVFNIFNFLFQFSMARMLSVADYGILATLFAIIYIFGVFTDSIQAVITKYTASEKNKGKIKNIFKRSFKKSINAAGMLFIVYLLIMVPLSSILKIDYLLLSLNGLIIFGAFLTPISRGVLQGRKRFGALGTNMVIDSFVKFALGVFLVFIGWKVYGAIAATVLGMFIAVIFSIIAIKDIRKSKESNASLKGIYEYTKPAFFIVLLVMVFYSIDIIIARILFSAEIAGKYAIASVLSKTIFMVTDPISRAMFPLSAENKKNERKAENVFLNAISILGAVLFVLILVFYFVPDLLIKIFSGRVIPESVSVLALLALAAGFMSLTNLILLYKLSLGKLKGCYFLAIFVLAEIVLLFYFSASLVQYSMALITASIAFLWGSIVFLRE